MKIIVISLICAAYLCAQDVKYGNSDNELKLGDGILKIVNCDNPYIFVPWCKEVGLDAKWIECEVTFQKFLTIRDAPKTYDVILVSATVVGNDMTVNFVYRDDWVDGAVYGKPVLRNGKYSLVLNSSGSRYVIRSIKQ